MKKIVLVLVLVLSGFAVMSVMASDAQFRQMEEKKVFDKIRSKMIVGCYLQNKKPAANISSLEQLKSLYPDRIQPCGCFQAGLARVSNRTIYEDSKHSYQLYMQKNDALKLKDKARFRQVEAEINAFEPFISKIIRKCALNKH